jgi:hypothetical protein
MTQTDYAYTTKTIREETKRRLGRYAELGYAVLSVPILFSPMVRDLARVEDKTGDDEHSRHRQQLRERLGGCLLVGILHPVSPGLSLDLEYAILGYAIPEHQALDTRHRYL